MPTLISQPLRKVKVCCFCEEWESGGIESFLSNVLQRFDLEKFQVDIVTSCLRQSVFTKSLEKRGVRFFELSRNQKNLIQNHKLFSDLLKRENYTVVHLNIFHGLSLYYAQLAKQAGIPVRIAHSHNTALRKSAMRPLKLLIHKIAKELYTNAATDLWACSRSAAEFLFSKRALETNSFHFIPNGIEIERFRFDPTARKNIRKELGLENKFVIGNVGRLCHQKNQSFLLYIFAQVHRQRKESYLLLVGEGEDKSQLEEQADRLGIADKVLFYGVTDHVEQLMWVMDVFAFPSRFEGLGIAAIEAQAAGLPVIASEFVPCEAHVTSQFQMIPLDVGPVQWAKRLLQLSPAWMDRTEAAALVRNAGFDVADVATQIENCYVRLLHHDAT